jgi:signal transduction histidine kinase
MRYALVQGYGLPGNMQRVLLITIAGAVLLVTGLHYLTSAHLLAYHSIYRSLYYLPIAGAAVAFGWRGGLAVALLVVALFLPHMLTMGAMMPGGLVDNVLELPMFVLIGGLVGWLADRAHAQRRRAERLTNYIDAVLQSLPLGVATARPGAALQPRNRAARELLPALAPGEDPAARSTGYHTLQGGARPLGLYVAVLEPHAAADERVYVLEDLTEQHALEAQLRRVDRLASVGQLAAGIAHEIRNPLAILRATAQLLAPRLAADLDLQAYSRVLVGESDRIERLIGELLAYARPRPPQYAPIDLTALLHDVAANMHPYAVQHDSTILLGLPPPVDLYADGEQVRQALVNVLLNAIQAGAPGGRVWLAAETGPQTVTISVCDNGLGMPPEVRDRACDPFFTTRPDGTGLGLALVASIVQEHGGTLQIDSAPGCGTTVKITLPCEAAHGTHPDR